MREVTTAARLGGGDVGGNPRLRAAITAAKNASMPADNIERAIKKGTGALEGPPVEETQYEGYAPGGVAVFVEAQTDNKNRTTSEVRASFTKLGGNLGTAGSVGYLFTRCGQFLLDAASTTEERVLDVALEAGAEDVRTEGENILVACEHRLFAALLDALEAAGLQPHSAELTMVPQNHIRVTGADAETVLRLVERLEDLDDVHKVYANFDIDEAELERLAQGS